MTEEKEILIHLFDEAIKWYRENTDDKVVGCDVGRGMYNAILDQQEVNVAPTDYTYCGIKIVPDNDLDDWQFRWVISDNETIS